MQAKAGGAARGRRDGGAIAGQTDSRYNRCMFFVEIFLLLIFTVLCGILLALWRIRELLEQLQGSGTALGAAPPSSAARPPGA